MDLRSILHIDLDAFFVAVECLKNSQFKDKPLIIGGSSGRGVVASCSYEARQYGVHSAMPMRMALRLCPDATVLKGDMDSYTRFSNMVTEIIQEDAPLYEKASIDEFYLDLTGMDRFFGCFKWSGELKQKIVRETGLPISFALSVNKLVSKVGTGEVKPDGAWEVAKGTEKAFLAPLSVAKIPMIGDKTYRQLCRMGVRQVATLREIPVKLLEREFGKSGITLWERANAIDHSPVEPYTERKSISTERTFATDTTDVAALQSMLVNMTEQLGFELRNQQKLTSCVTVKIRYSDFNTHTQQKRIPYSGNDDVLIDHVKELFAKLYNRRLLIRLIGVKFSRLVQGNHQISLFDDTAGNVRLYQAIDRMKHRYGYHAVGRAAGLPGLDTH